MKLKALLVQAAGMLTLVFASKGFAQVPQASFSVGSSTVCAGTIVTFTDLSTNSPTAWTYTINSGPGPVGTVTSSAQDPSIIYNTPGTKTITLIAANASGSSTPVSHTLLVIAAPNAAINPTTASSCIGGNPVILTINTATTNNIAWNTGATTTSISVSPTVTTTYTVVLTNSAGCTTTRTAVVNIGPPTINVVSNPTAVCGGGSVTISANTPGQGPSTYTWSNAVTTRTLSTNVPGVYTVSVTTSNGCSGTQSYTLGTTNSIAITATSAQTAICAGNNANLFATGASSYTWSTGATNQVTAVSPTVTSTYSVVGASGTCTASATVSIIVNTIPTLALTSAPSTLCAGSAATLNATGATTYSWTTGGNTNSIVVTPTANTTYTVRGANPGCMPRTATIAVHVLSSPVLVLQMDNDTICDGQEAIIAASGASTYSWSTGSTQPILTITPSVTTTYSVTGANSGGCSSSNSITQYVVECTGIKTISGNNSLLTIYPNPNNGVFQLSAQGTLNLSLLNETGQLVKTISLNDTNDHKASVTGLASGIYFIVGQNIAVRQKIVVTNQ